MLHAGLLQSPTTSGTKELLDIVEPILDSRPRPSLLVADNEGFTTELVDHINRKTPFDLLMPFPAQTLLPEKTSGAYRR